MIHLAPKYRIHHSLFFFFFLLFTLSLVGCGKSKIKLKHSEASSKTQENLNHNTEEEFSDVPDPQFTKAIDEDQPEGLVKLFKFGEDGKDCTGFLIEKDMILTNRHCLSEVHREKGASCKEDYAVIFPPVGDKEGPRRFFAVQCEEVVTVGQDENFDYAILKLAKPVERKFFEIDYSGIEDGEELTVWVTDPFDADLVSKIEKHTCKSLMGSALNVLYNNKYSIEVSFVGCPEIEDGNSGSPLIGANGKVKGVVNAGLITEKVKEVFKFRKIEEPFKQITSGINFSCLNNEILKGNTGPECLTDLSQEKRDEVARTLLNTHIQYLWKQLKESQEFNPYTEELSAFRWEPNIIDYDLFPLNLADAWFEDVGVFMTPQAVCYYENASEFKTEVNKELVRDIELPAWEIEISYDKYFRPQFEVVEIDFLFPSFNFAYANFGNEIFGPIKTGTVLKRKAGILHNEVTVQDVQELKLCL